MLVKERVQRIGGRSEVGDGIEGTLTGGGGDGCNGGRS
jgi:hypothetical protein